MRQYTTRFKCGYPGCEEYGHYSSATRSEQAELQKRYFPDRWRCTRHTNLQEVLGDGNLSRVSEVTVFAVPHGKFWGHDKPIDGFMYGPGFKAYARDFPEGTRLRVTAEIILPDPTP